MHFHNNGIVSYCQLLFIKVNILPFGRYGLSKLQTCL